MPKLESALEALPKAVVDYKQGFVIKRFIRFASPENKLKLKAPKLFKPVDQENPAASIIDKLIQQQKKLTKLMNQAMGLNLNHGKFPSPITTLLKFTPGQAFLLLVRHQQRHCLQIERLLPAE
ncbi:MAG: DinB family protein [Lentisphaeria bacterium]|nr:DinB family protein [Lentisphaeria bacterium]